MWSILLMVLARRDWPSPPISPAVYLTSFGECRVSKIRQGNNNVRLSTYGGVMKERGTERSGEEERKRGTSGELQLVLEAQDLQSSSSPFSCEVSGGDAPKKKRSKKSKASVLFFSENTATSCTRV